MYTTSRTASIDLAAMEVQFTYLHTYIHIMQMKKHKRKYKIIQKRKHSHILTCTYTITIVEWAWVRWCLRTENIYRFSSYSAPFLMYVYVCMYVCISMYVWMYVWNLWIVREFSVAPPSIHAHHISWGQRILLNTYIHTYI